MARIRTTPWPVRRDDNKDRPSDLRPVKRLRRASGDDNKDRLSDLPECIILHILSFLSIKLAVRTCVLSTRWKHLWKRIPTLTLSSREFWTLKKFSIFLSKILTLRDTSTAPHAIDLFRRGDIEPRLLKKFLKYVFSHNIHLRQLGISVSGDSGLIFSCVSSCRALTSLKLSIHPRGGNVGKTLFPKSLNLPLLTSLDLTNFAFCGDENDCADPFLEFTKLKSLVIYSCEVIDAKILTISSHTLDNLALHNNSSLFAKIKLYAPSLCTFNYTSGEHIHEICGSGLSSIKQVNIKSLSFSASKEDALVLFSWLVGFANIESLTVTSIVLQILSLVPDVLEAKLRSLHNLKSLKIELIPIEEGSLLELMIDAMLKKAARKSPNEFAKLTEALETSLEAPAIPDGIVNFLRQNSPSVEVNITTEHPSLFNMKQIEESINGVKIIKYGSRFSMPSSSCIPQLYVRSPSSVAPALDAKSASDVAPASAAPALAAKYASDAAPTSAAPALAAMSASAAPALAAMSASDAAHVSIAPALAVISASDVAHVSIAPALAAMSTSDAAQVSTAPALAVMSTFDAAPASPNLHLCLSKTDVKPSNNDEDDKHQPNTDSLLQDNGK